MFEGFNPMQNSVVACDNSTREVIFLQQKTETTLMVVDMNFGIHETLSQNCNKFHYQSRVWLVAMSKYLAYIKHADSLEAGKDAPVSTPLPSNPSNDRGID